MPPVATLSLDSVAMAEVFELRVRAHVPPGSIAYFPDTIPMTGDVESSAPVTWESQRAQEGGAELTLVYPLMPFGVGTIVVPGVEIVTAPVGGQGAGQSIADGSLVGTWSDAPTGIAAGIVRTRTPALTAWVRPVYTPEDVVAGVSPRGPDDVIGLGFSPWTALFLTVFTVVLVTAAAPWARSALALRAARRASGPSRPRSPEEARLVALAELDRIAAMPYALEAEGGLYAATSGAVRGYAQYLDPAWAPGLTSTEVMHGLGARAPGTGALAEQMRVAERVKFGRLRTGDSAFASHLGTLRDWLSTSGQESR